MGGIMSGRWGAHTRRRRIGEGTLELPVSALLELAKAPAGRVSGFAWGELLKLRATSGEPEDLLENTLTVRRITFCNMEGVQLGAVMLAGYRAPFGGVRWWIDCPQCGHDRRALYFLTASCYSWAYLESTGGAVPFRWKCRQCSGLTYHSQRLEPVARLQYKSRKIAARLGKGDASWHCENRYFPKPKGMHWRTWERLNSKLDRVEAAWQGASLQRIAGFLARYENSKSRP